MQNDMKDSDQLHEPSVTIPLSLLRGAAWRALSPAAKALFLDLRALATSSGISPTDLASIQGKASASPAEIELALFELRVLGFVAPTATGHRFTDLNSPVQPETGTATIPASRDYESIRSVHAAEQAIADAFAGLAAGNCARALPTGPEAHASAAAGAVDPCPHEAIIGLYHELLPMCPRVRAWTPARVKALRARWNEEPKRQSLDYWRNLFTCVSESSFLTGNARTAEGRKPFVASLDWIVKVENFTKIREGKYEDGGPANARPHSPARDRFAGAK